MEELTPIVVGMDGSASSVDALRWAWGVAANRRRPIIALTVGRSDGEARRLSSHALLQAFHGAPPENLTAVTRVGDAARILSESSAHAFLLVVGSRGPDGVASEIHSGCPMVTMHHTHAPEQVPQKAPAPAPAAGR